MEPRERSNRQTHISHTAIGGYAYGSGDNVHTSVGIKPLSNARSYDTEPTACYVGLDALFTPVTVVNVGGTNYSGNLYMPTMWCTGLITEPNSTSLNPYRHGEWISDYRTSEFEGVVPESGASLAHVMAMKLPMLGAGWGFDKAERFVPDDPNYRTNPSSWKVGPLDFRWNPHREVWGVGEPIKIAKLVKKQDGNYDVYSPFDATTPLPSSIPPAQTIGLEYTTVCSGEQIYAYDLKEDLGVYSALTKPVRGVRVITGIQCVNNILYLQYAYIGTPFVATGYTLETSGNKVTVHPTSNPCDDLNSQPFLVSVPLHP